MSLLRSVIADARSRKPMLEPLNSPLTATAFKTRGMVGNVAGADKKSPGTADHTRSLNKPLSIREGNSATHMGDVPDSQLDNSLNQGIQDMGSNVEFESPLSVPMNKAELIPNEESSLDFEGDKASNSEESMAPQLTGTVIPNSSMNSSMNRNHDLFNTYQETQIAQNQVPDHEVIEPASLPAIIRDISAQEEVAGEIATNQHYSEGSIKGNETLTIQSDSTQTTASTLPAKSRQIELSVLEASSVPFAHSPDSLGNSTSDNTAGRNEVEKELDNNGKARQVLPPVDKQADMKSMSNQEEIPRFQKPGDTKGVHCDVQLVSRPAKPLPGPEALRSVPVTPFQTDSISKAGDTLRSRTPLRTPEKTHETPKVQIGRIDVIIESAVPPVTKQAPASSPIDLASRHYLRRL